MARPLARGRVLGLSRLTAPTHSAGFWLALWAAAAAASFVALIPVLFDRGPPAPGYEVIHTLSGRLLRGVRPHRLAPPPRQRASAVC